MKCGFGRGRRPMILSHEKTRPDSIIVTIVTVNDFGKCYNSMEDRKNLILLSIFEKKYGIEHEITISICSLCYHAAFKWSKKV